MHHGHRRTRTQRRATGVSKRPSYWTTTTTKTSPQQDLTRLALATLSPLFFASHYLNFHPEPAQAHVLRTAHFSKRIVLNCNRQWGKSTVAAILITHRLFTIPNSLVLIVAPAGRQSGEVALKIKAFLYELNLELTSDGINPNSIVLPNGSRLVTLPAVDGTARGYSAVSMLLFDEASRIKDRIYLAFRPMLAVAQGDLILVSTPNGKRGFFYREMAGQGHDSSLWFRHTGPVTECIPRISLKVIEEEKAKGDAYFRQEWLCEFIETGIYAIDEETIHKLIKHEIEAYKWI
jgi:hypothetical protein